MIDVHNHMRQKVLRLEKHWVKIPYFHIILGLCAVDYWNGYRHHLQGKHHHKNIELLLFMNILIEDLWNIKESRVAIDDRDDAKLIGDIDVPVPSSASIASSIYKFLTHS